MAKFPEAIARLHQNVFVCKKCKTKIRSNIQKIMLGKISCRRCKSKNFRPIKKGK
ncbi:MAG: hypothetical protein QGF74_03205 [Candidatus Nanoarchaeia archaeon]|jgi:ribosomal protein L40E|nr:hypothetical protein [Candidatus Nanoarchaeia archaeon]|tara:strand:- start:362 stop:526 length:165 start_codon:yes stop_codon:yes gene_type:complete